MLKSAEYLERAQGAEEVGEEASASARAEQALKARNWNALSLFAAAHEQHEPTAEAVTPGANEGPSTQLGDGAVAT